MSDRVKLTSTSGNSAVGEDLVLRATSTTRLVFRPTVVNNFKDESKPVKGEFLFQRKRPSEEWEKIASKPLSHIPAGELLGLSLSTEEVSRLFDRLRELYDVHLQHGVSSGTVIFVRERDTAGTVSSATQSHLHQALATAPGPTIEAVTKLIRWAVSQDRLSAVVEELGKLDDGAVASLRAAAGVAALKQALQVWTSRLEEDRNEDFWHGLLESHAFLLEQLFLLPVAILKSKPYVGGKSIMNLGGTFADFLMCNRITRNSTVVEIKTPNTLLLGSRYRDNVLNVSSELSGAVMQVLHQRDQLVRQYLAIRDRSADDFEALSPRGLVIIGNAGREFQGDRFRRDAFELVRSAQTGVSIVTFDEMLNRLAELIRLLEQPQGKESDS